MIRRSARLIGQRRRASPRRRPRASPRRRQRRRREIINPNVYVYCGNNQLYQHPDQNIQVEFGTKYRCLRKGFGAGYHSPLDITMLQPYQPIDNRKIYCGMEENLPNGYDRLGNAPDCFQKGFASGKLKRARREN